MSRAPLSNPHGSVFFWFTSPATCSLRARSSRYPAGNLGRHSPQSPFPVTPLGPGIGSPTVTQVAKKEQKGSPGRFVPGSHLAEHCCCPLVLYLVLKAPEADRPQTATAAGDTYLPFPTPALARLGRRRKVTRRFCWWRWVVCLPPPDWQTATPGLSQ